MGVDDLTVPRSAVDPPATGVSPRVQRECVWSAPGHVRSGEVPVKIHDPSSNAMDKDYDITDIERLMGKRDWRDHNEMIKWLEKEGDADRRFTPGEVRHMIDDLSRVKNSGKPMAKDPEQLFKQLQSSR
jgi:hypothetical protein